MKIIFLDIDGVLNGHGYNELAGSTPILPRCVAHLNRIIAETGASVVISSAWRYMVHGGSMTLAGFAYLLKTHQVEQLRVVGLTCRDEEIVSRGIQIAMWIIDHRAEVESFVVLDDAPDDMDFAPVVARLVRCESMVGLTDRDADKAIAMLSVPLSPPAPATLANDSPAGCPISPETTHRPAGSTA